MEVAEEFYPSEIARLILGYLYDIQCLFSWDIFLVECADLQEHREHCSEGKKRSTNVNGKSLKEILQEYCQFVYAETQGRKSAASPDINTIRSNVRSEHEHASDENMEVAESDEYASHSASTPMFNQSNDETLVYVLQESEDVNVPGVNNDNITIESKPAQTQRYAYVSSTTKPILHPIRIESTHSLSDQNSRASVQKCPAEHKATQTDSFTDSLCHSFVQTELSLFDDSKGSWFDATTRARIINNLCDLCSENLPIGFFKYRALESQQVLSKSINFKDKRKSLIPRRLLTDYVFHERMKDCKGEQEKMMKEEVILLEELLRSQPLTWKIVKHINKAFCISTESSEQDVTNAERREIALSSMIADSMFSKYLSFLCCKRDFYLSSYKRKNKNSLNLNCDVSMLSEVTEVYEDLNFPNFKQTNEEDNIIILDDDSNHLQSTKSNRIQDYLQNFQKELGNDVSIISPSSQSPQSALKYFSRVPQSTSTLPLVSASRVEDSNSVWTVLQTEKSNTNIILKKVSIGTAFNTQMKLPVSDQKCTAIPNNPKRKTNVTLPVSQPKTVCNTHQKLILPSTCFVNNNVCQAFSPSTQMPYSSILLPTRGGSNCQNQYSLIINPTINWPCYTSPVGQFSVLNGNVQNPVSINNSVGGFLPQKPIEIREVFHHEDIASSVEVTTDNGGVPKVAPKNAKPASSSKKGVPSCKAKHKRRKITKCVLPKSNVLKGFLPVIQTPEKNNVLPDAQKVVSNTTFSRSTSDKCNVQISPLKSLISSAKLLSNKSPQPNVQHTFLDEQTSTNTDLHQYCEDSDGIFRRTSLHMKHVNDNNQNNNRIHDTININLKREDSDSSFEVSKQVSMTDAVLKAMQNALEVGSTDNQRPVSNSVFSKMGELCVFGSSTVKELDLSLISNAKMKKETIEANTNNSLIESQEMENSQSVSAEVSPIIFSESSNTDSLYASYTTATTEIVLNSKEISKSSTAIDLSNQSAMARKPISEPNKQLNSCNSKSVDTDLYFNSLCFSEVALNEGENKLAASKIVSVSKVSKPITKTKHVKNISSKTNSVEKIKKVLKTKNMHIVIPKLFDDPKLSESSSPEVVIIDQKESDSYKLGLNCKFRKKSKSMKTYLRKDRNRVKLTDLIWDTENNKIVNLEQKCTGKPVKKTEVHELNADGDELFEENCNKTVGEAHKFLVLGENEKICTERKSEKKRVNLTAVKKIANKKLKTKTSSSKHEAVENGIDHVSKTRGPFNLIEDMTINIVASPRAEVENKINKNPIKRLRENGNIKTKTCKGISRDTKKKVKQIQSSKRTENVSVEPFVQNVGKLHDDSLHSEPKITAGQNKSTINMLSKNLHFPNVDKASKNTAGSVSESLYCNGNWLKESHSEADQSKQDILKNSKQIVFSDSAGNKLCTRKVTVVLERLNMEALVDGVSCTVLEKSKDLGLPQGPGCKSKNKSENEKHVVVNKMKLSVPPKKRERPFPAFSPVHHVESVSSHFVRNNSISSSYKSNDSVQNITKISETISEGHTDAQLKQLEGSDWYSEILPDKKIILSDQWSYLLNIHSEKNETFSQEHKKGSKRRSSKEMHLCDQNVEVTNDTILSYTEDCNMVLEADEMTKTTSTISFLQKSKNNPFKDDLPFEVEKIPNVVNSACLPNQHKPDLVIENVNILTAESNSMNKSQSGRHTNLPAVLPSLNRPAKSSYASNLNRPQIKKSSLSEVNTNKNLEQVTKILNSCRLTAQKHEEDVQKGTINKLPELLPTSELSNTFETDLSPTLATNNKQKFCLSQNKSLEIDNDKTIKILKDIEICTNLNRNLNCTKSVSSDEGKISNPHNITFNSAPVNESRKEELMPDLLTARNQVAESELKRKIEVKSVGSSELNNSETLKPIISFSDSESILSPDLHEHSAVVGLDDTSPVSQIQEPYTADVNNSSADDFWSRLNDGMMDTTKKVNAELLIAKIKEYGVENILDLLHEKD